MNEMHQVEFEVVELIILVVMQFERDTVFVSDRTFRYFCIEHIFQNSFHIFFSFINIL